MVATIPINQIKKHTRGERVFFVMKLWTPKNTILYGEGVGAIAPASVIEGSTIVVLELVEDAGTSEVGVTEGVSVVTGTVNSVGILSVGVELVELFVTGVTIGSVTGSYPFRYPVTTQSNSTSEAFPPKLFTIK